MLHLRDPDALLAIWKSLPQGERYGFLAKRPLLAELDQPRHGLRRCLAVERGLWEQVNKQRYRAYQHALKEFFRRWRTEPGFNWPSNRSFAEQHRMVSDAAVRMGLPLDPLGGPSGRLSVIATAKSNIAEIFAATEDLLEAVTPPIAQLLP